MINIRPADICDMERVYILSNDEVVRSVSFNSQKITWEDHVEWYNRNISDIEKIFLVGFKNDEIEGDNSFIGQIRLNKKSENCYEISISISSAFRGKGFGKELMKSTIEWLKINTKISQILARIKENNNASINFFKSCGYVQIKPDDKELINESILEFILPIN